MAGKGDLRDAMIRRAAELNISGKVDFPGFLNDDEVIDLFHRSDVFVMPSVSEPFGLVALEAMQAEVPVILSRQSGASEILKNVVSVDYWDTKAMSEAMMMLLYFPEIGNELRKSGKMEVEQLSWNLSAANVRKTYINLIHQGEEGTKSE